MNQAHAATCHANADEPSSRGVHKFELLAAAACDPELTRADVAVLAVILGHANSRSGVAWPGINRIAEQAKLHRVTVVHGIAKLEFRRWVQVDRAERGKSNRYRPIFRGSSATATSSEAATSSATATGVVAPTLLEVVAPTLPEPRKREPRKSEPRMSRAKNALDSRFADLWAIYPRRVAKQSAEKAFRDLKPDEIEAALADVKRRVTAEWKGKDPQYIPHPATYLRGKRWNDEPQGGSQGANFKTAKYDVPDYLSGAI